MADYGVDSQKLLFHPERVANWIRGNIEYPINIEVGISGTCNHRCIFCCVDHMGYEPSFLDFSQMKTLLDNASEKGLKSMLLSGNGEPCLNKDFSAIVNYGKSIGIDVALSTNGVLFAPEKIDESIESLSWVKYSVSAGTEETYKKIHRGKDGDLQRVFDSIQYASKMRDVKNLDVVLGVQIVMTPDNAHEVLLLARTAKELGANWFTVKSVGFNELSSNIYRNTFDYNEFYGKNSELKFALDKLSDDKFKAIYRNNRISKCMQARRYSECYASDFYCCIDANGNVYPCCNMLGDPRYIVGNIKTQDFASVWEGDKRRTVMNNIKLEKMVCCPFDCRLSNMNEYLYEIKNPGKHFNFI